MEGELEIRTEESCLLIWSTCFAASGDHDVAIPVPSLQPVEGRELAIGGTAGGAVTGWGTARSEWDAANRWGLW